ncbi:predicted GPI-anchored protein 26 [Diutina catenulata]
MFAKTVAASALAATAMAAYSNQTVVTTDVTVTDFVTYCPESTTITITTCENDVCVPHTTECEPGTVTITGECVVPVPATVTVIECVECAEGKTTVTTWETPAPQPEPTKEGEDKTKTVVPGPVETPVPTKDGEEKPAPTEEGPEPTVAGPSKVPEVTSTFEGAAGKAVVGFAGVAAVAAAFL